MRQVRSGRQQAQHARHCKEQCTRTLSPAQLSATITAAKKSVKATVGARTRRTAPGRVPRAPMQSTNTAEQQRKANARPTSFGCECERGITHAILPRTVHIRTLRDKKRCHIHPVTHNGEVEGRAAVGVVQCVDGLAADGAKDVVGIPLTQQGREAVQRPRSHCAMNG